MAKARVNFDVHNFIKLVLDNPLSWDSRRDDYRLAENKSLVWHKVAAAIQSDRDIWIAFSNLYWFFTASSFADSHVT